METVSKKVKSVPKGDSRFSLYEIAASVERDTKGQMNVEARIATDDISVVFELIAAALYKAMRRRGVGHVKALKSTEELISITDIKVVM